VSELAAAPWVLVVDDEVEMRTLVAYSLASQGFEVSEASNAAEAWELLTEKSFDVIILDMVMPGASGAALCARIRETSDTPIIMLSALSSPDHRVVGLEAGADDYVAKPFNPRELALRATALYRRSQRAVEDDVVNGALVINRTQRSVKYHGVEVRLSESEFRVCVALAEHTGLQMSYAALIDAVWTGMDATGGKEMLKTTVWRLRSRLSQVNPGPLIDNVRGVGYSMVKLNDPTNGSLTTGVL